MLTIRTNTLAAIATRNLESSQQRQSTAMTRLSSGLRINSAKDDAAGLAISERFTSQIRGLNRAYQNTNDGISLINVSESSIRNLQNNLSRIRELAVQASNAVNSDSDREDLNREAQQRLAEFDRVVESTQFNGVQVFSADTQDFAFQVGAEKGQVISASVSSIKASNLGVLSPNRVVASSTSSAFSNGDLVINDVRIVSSSSMGDMISSTFKAQSAISKVAAINFHSAETGVQAVARKTIAEGTAMGAVPVTGTVTINDVAINVSTLAGAENIAQNRKTIAAAVNAYSSESGVYAVDTESDQLGVRLIAEDGRNIHIESTVADTSTGLPDTDSVTYGSYELVSDDEIVVSSGKIDGNLASTGLTAGEYEDNLYSVSAQNVPSTALSEGDLVINDLRVGPSVAQFDVASTVDNAGSAIAKAAAVNMISSKTGVYAEASETRVSGSAMNGSTFSGTITVNGIQSSNLELTVDTQNARSTVTKVINQMSSRTGVQAVSSETASDGISLVAVDGRNIEVSAAGTGSVAQRESATGLDIGTHIGTYRLMSSAEFSVDTATGDIENSGFNLLDEGEEHVLQRLSGLSLSTQADAQLALETIDAASESLLKIQTDLGAILNRFESAMNVNQSTSLNLSAAKSRVVDADYAAESASMSRESIIRQAATSVFSTNSLNSSLVLSLLA